MHDRNWCWHRHLSFRAHVSFALAFSIFYSHLAGRLAPFPCPRNSLPPLPKMFSYTILMICSRCAVYLPMVYRATNYSSSLVSSPFLYLQRFLQLLVFFSRFLLLAPSPLLSFSFVIFHANRTLSFVVLVIPPSLDLRTPSIFLTNPSFSVSHGFYNFTYRLPIYSSLFFIFAPPLLSALHHGRYRSRLS